MALQLLEGCLCTCLFLHDPLLQKKLLVSLTGYDKQNSACLWRLINERSGSNETMWNKSFDFIGDVDTSYISLSYYYLVLLTEKPKKLASMLQWSFMSGPWDHEAMEFKQLWQGSIYLAW